MREYAFFEKKIREFEFSQLPFRKPNIRLASEAEFSLTVVVGLGGSSLGAKAIAEALDLGGKLSFLDNIDPDFAEKIISEHKEKTRFLFISKSGETLEVLTLADIILKKMTAANRNQCLAITDDPGSSLGKLAKKYGIPIIESPKKIPGRFSVLSEVGLVPAKLAGCNINGLLAGARKTDWRKAFGLACRQYNEYKRGKNIVVIFPYAERLNSFCDWYIQLLAESIGKTEKIGITPTKAMGVKDQHSQLQLFLDGPDDKFYIFIKPRRSKAGPKNLQRIFDAEYDGVKRAFKKRKKTFYEIKLTEINEQTLGELFFFFELEVAFLGLIFDVNFQNQPAVELNKMITKTLLK